MFIVLPTTLVSQWRDEWQRWTLRHSVDLFEYVGGCNDRHRIQFWEGLFAKSEQPLYRRVVLIHEGVSAIH